MTKLIFLTNTINYNIVISTLALLFGTRDKRVEHFAIAIVYGALFV